MSLYPRVEFHRELKVERDKAIKMERLATVPHKAGNTSLTRNSPSTAVDTTQVLSYHIPGPSRSVEGGSGDETRKHHLCHAK